MTPKSGTRPWHLCLFILITISSSAWAEKDSFIPFWVDESGKTSQEVLDKTIRLAKLESPTPDHIAILVHGFKTPREASRHEFNIVGKRIREEFEKQGKTILILGLQWKSEAGGFVLMLPKKYKKKTKLARKIGRLGARQLLLSLQDAYPESKLSIFAHSMGCELSAAAVNLKLEFDEVTDQIVPHRKDEDINLSGLIFCGSDLDFDVLLGSKNARVDRTKLLWLTMSELLGEHRDSVLDLRQMLRGRALGSTLPRMSTEQFDMALGQRRMMFDQQDIPINHSFTAYYNTARLQRVISSILHYSEPSADAPEDIAAVNEVFEARGNLELLLPYLDHRLASARIYSLWAIERIFCGEAHHLGDGYLQDIELTLRKKPRKDLLRRKHSRCELVKQGYYPTEKMLERAGAPSWATR